MTREQEIRSECLLQLYGAGELSRTAGSIRKAAKREDSLRDWSEDEVRRALFFLTGQGFAERIQDAATGEVRHVITSKGILEYEGRQ